MFSTYVELAKLAIESQQVITLRLLKIARGGPMAMREANRMVVEKAHAMVDASLLAASGAAPEKILRRCSRTVRSNRKRLLAGR